MVRIKRHAKRSRSYLLLSKRAAGSQGKGVLCLRLPHIFHFQAGQYAELKVLALSTFQWHPFTMASATHEPEMVFYVKACGDWTCSLCQVCNGASELPEEVEVHVRGPFGSPAQHVGQFEQIILNGSGVGATPFCSVTKATRHWMENWMRKAENSVLGRLDPITQGRAP